MNRPDWSDVVFAAVAFGVIGFTVGCMLCGVSIQGLRVEAVKAGHAEWHTNDEGERSFKWKGNKEKKGHDEQQQTD